MAFKAGAIPAADMTPEAAITKLMHILAYAENMEDIRALFSESIAGEMTEESDS